MKRNKTGVPSTPKDNGYRDYRKRFEAVNALEIAELRQRSPEECLEQFVALMALAQAMHWEIHTPEEIDKVRLRWQKLKGYGG